MRGLGLFFFFGTIGVTFLICAVLGLAGGGRVVRGPEKPRVVRPWQMCRIHNEEMYFRSVPTVSGEAARERAAEMFGESYTNMAIAFRESGEGAAEARKYVCRRCNQEFEKFLKELRKQEVPEGVEGRAGEHGDGEVANRKSQITEENELSNAGR